MVEDKRQGAFRAQKEFTSVESISRYYELLIERYKKFSKVPEDPEVLFREIVKIAYQCDRIQEISQFLIGVSDPLTLLNPDREKYAFRADSFDTSSKEIMDLWLYECLPHLNRKLDELDKKDLTDEKLKKHITDSIQSLGDLKPPRESSNEAFENALITSFIISDDFDDPFKV